VLGLPHGTHTAPMVGLLPGDAGTDDQIENPTTGGDLLDSQRLVHRQRNRPSWQRAVHLGGDRAEG
jgi:hypothetical protein